MVLDAAPLERRVTPPVLCPLHDAPKVRYSDRMPYQWSSPTSQETRLTLWPYRSLKPQGFTIFIAITAGMFLLPLLVVLGSPVLWGLLPFFAGTLWLVWYFLQRSNRDRQMREDLVLTKATMTLTRTNPKGPAQIWTANPYWVRLGLHEKGGPVEQYLTLSGGGRDVELGAFLSIDERVQLHGDLADRLHRLNINAP